MVDEKPGRVTKTLKQQAEELNWTGVSFSTPIDGPDIRTFEESNEVSVVILGFDTTYMSLERKRESSIRSMYHGGRRNPVLSICCTYKSQPKIQRWTNPSLFLIVSSRICHAYSRPSSKHGHAHSYTVITVCNPYTSI